MPEIVDNVIPYIGGEEEKSEQEPLKLWGHIEGDTDRQCRATPVHHRTVLPRTGLRRPHALRCS